MRLDDEESLDAILSLRGMTVPKQSPSRVVARSEIPRLCFGTGSAISVGQMIATHLAGARNDKK